MSQKRNVHLIIRRFDKCCDPEPLNLEVELSQFQAYNLLKRQIHDLLDLQESDLNCKVVKIRNSDLILIPMSNLLNQQGLPFYVDVWLINNHDQSRTHLLQDAYLDAIRQKLHSMESRVQQVELLMPQMQSGRQTHLESTITTLSSRVSFLNKRFDELMPSTWKSKIAETIA